MNSNLILSQFLMSTEKFEEKESEEKFFAFYGMFICGVTFVCREEGAEVAMLRFPL